MGVPFPRQADYAIDPLFIQRWSNRAFTGDVVPDAVLFSAFEAARWAPSARNAQPWRFIYAKRDSADWPVFFGLLNERNQVWADKAGALILVVSATSAPDQTGNNRPLNSHAFDAGAAWANLALQVARLGWATRAIGGFDKEAARVTLDVPEGFALQVIIAVGKPADKDTLPEEFQDREFPTGRVKVTELAWPGKFRAA
jgi:nitroreductase